MIPTPEQQVCIDAFSSEMAKLKIRACAGSGKTSTLELMARSTHRNGIYICFNKSIADASAKRFPENVACRTAHSLAYRSMIRTYKGSKSKMGDSIRARDTQQILAIKDFPILNGTSRLDSSTIAYAVNQTVRRFQQSASQAVEIEHFATLPKFKTLERVDFLALREKVVMLASQLWEQMHDPASNVPLGHDGYLKAWHLTQPTIEAEFILADEWQDTNPVLLDVLTNQFGVQLVGVGDPFQQIYEWRGAVNAMDIMKADRECILSKSFRFGPVVADVATRILRSLGDPVTILGHDPIDSELTAERQKTIIFRTNAGIFDKLIEILDEGTGTAVYVNGGVTDLMNIIEGVERLQANKTSTHPLFMGFEHWPAFVTYAEKSGDGEAEKIVKLIDKYGTGQLKSALWAVRSHEDMAEVILTTAHKSKGREWPGVSLANDFRAQPEKDPESDKDNPTFTVNPAETRLFYVAATRAINALQLPDWAYKAYGMQVPAGQNSDRGNPITQEAA
jgi:superfamily I DNA/RNA helicase